MHQELYCCMKSACSQVLCCSSPFPMTDPTCLILGSLPFWQDDPEAGRLPTGFPRMWPNIRNTLQFPVKAQSSWDPSTPHLALLESVPWEKLTASIEQREEFRASEHCPAVSPELPGAQVSPLSSQGPGRLH